MIAVNLTGVFLGMKASVPELKKSGNGSIVNVSSIAGLQGFGSVAPKYGVRGLAKFRCDRSGPVQCSRQLDSSRVDQDTHDRGRRSVPAARRHERGGDQIEVSRMVLLLASDDSSFSMGSELVIDGGETAGLAQCSAAA
ncbi:SDR family oxidoreductase [Rhodococcus qingshengii]|uniref:SDR family oxidoreductase n=1 Tax=Rhodococcus qingshengii TaxID=334542 RepID=UPI0035E04E70